MTLKELKQIFDILQNAPEKSLERCNLYAHIHVERGEKDITIPIDNMQIICEGSMAPKLIFNCYE